MNDTSAKIWLGLGAVGGFFAAIFLFSAGLALAEWATIENVAHHLKDWQTLITGGLAVLVAIITIFWLEKQIAQGREQAEDQRERKQFADRAALPAALATLLRYGTKNLQILVSLKQNGLRSSGEVKFDAAWEAPQVPDFPMAAAETVRKCLESSDRNKRQPIAQILIDLQRISSRLSGILVEVRSDSIMVVTESHLSDYIAGALEFITRCDHTIPYARGTEEAPPDNIASDAVASKAFFEDIYEDDYPLVYEAINRSNAE